MAEPEEVIAEAAHLATTAVRRLWSRDGSPAAPGLATVRRRLELFLAAVFDDPPEIAAAQPPAPRSLLARLAGRGAHDAAGAIASTDGRRIRLPRRLEGLPADTVPARFRLLALEQAARAGRGTPAQVPDSPLARDLYLLAEAAAVERDLCALLPGIASELRTARTRALEARTQRRSPEAARSPWMPRAPRSPRSPRSPRAEEVERLTRALLGADPVAPPPEVPAPETPGAARAWALSRAARILALPGPYPGVPPVDHWGTVTAAVEGAAGAGEPQDGGTRRRPRTAPMRRRPRVRQAEADEDDDRTGTWIVRADDPQESVEDPAGLQRPADRLEDAAVADLADSLSELPDARLVRTPEPPREVLASDDPPPHAAGAERERTAAGIVYPEWDYRTGAYRARGAIVREVRPTLAEPAWADAALHRHAPLVRRVRRDFERLRPRRQLLTRQPDGSDLDVDAFVAAFADAAAGAPATGRLYLQDRQVRRDAAILLLADVSASTDSWIEGSRRTIDVEKEGLLIVAEALAALGDRHAILAFRGEGPERVELLAMKRFDESSGPAVRGRIGALEPDGYTRVGAAVRHATTLLAREPARHRLLLLLSDGRPNDVDAYEGRYGLEDTRQALAEARLQGAHPFCLTVDREAPRYAPRIFGRAGYAVVPRPEHFPRVLVDVLRALLRSNGR